MSKTIQQAIEEECTAQSQRPEEVASLTLDGKCRATRIEGLDEFVALEELSMSNIGLTSLEGFPKLKELTTLILSDNKISGGLDHLVNAELDLQELDLSGCSIAKIEDLEPLKDMQLVSLDLYQCPITHLDSYREQVFGLIKSLKYLDNLDKNNNERQEDYHEDEVDDEEEDDDDDEGDDEDDLEDDEEGDDAEGYDDEYDEGGNGGDYDDEDEEEEDDLEDDEDDDAELGTAHLLGPDGAAGGEYGDEDDEDEDFEQGEGDDEDEDDEEDDTEGLNLKRKREDDEAEDDEDDEEDED